MYGNICNSILDHVYLKIVDKDYEILNCCSSPPSLDFSCSMAKGSNFFADRDLRDYIGNAINTIVFTASFFFVDT